MSRLPARIVASFTTTLLIVLCCLAVLAPQASAAAVYNWTNTGGGIASMNVKALKLDQAHNKLYAGTQSNGVWRCSNPGTAPAWTKISAAGNVGSQTIYAMDYDSGRDILYVSTRPTTKANVWRCDAASTAGYSWHKISDVNIESFSFVLALTIDPVHNLLYVGDGENAMGGAGVGAWRCVFPTTVPAWTKICSIGDIGADQIFSMTYDVTHNILFADVFGRGVHRCTNPNAGSSWHWLDIDPSGAMSGNLLYDGARNQLYKAEMKGVVERADNPNGTPSWADLTSTSILPGGSAFNGMCLDASRHAVYVGSPNLAFGTSHNGMYVINNADGTGTPAVADTGGALDSYKCYCSAYDPLSDKVFAATTSVGVWSAPVLSQVFPTWYLAEGTTAWGFSDQVSIENPNPVALTAKVTYMPKGSANVVQTVALPASSQTTINPVDKLGEKDFSTMVECTDTTKTIAVDRTLSWNGQGAASPEAHSSIGVTSPSATWYLPEGSSAWGFECWLLVQNPGATDATCTFTYMIEGVGAATKTHAVKAHSRETFNMQDDIGQHDASIKISSNVPVIPERAMYRNSRREGHDSIGTVAPATDYYLAEGTTAWGFTTYVLVQNPNSTATDVTITYMTPSGPKAQPIIKMPPNSRQTVLVNSISSVSNTDLSTWVHGSQPIIAERAMYWGAGTVLGEACHDSIGMASAHTTFYLPDGYSNPEDAQSETWTLVQNPNSTDVQVRITYLKPDGTGNVSLTDTVPKNSRKTYNMEDKVEGRASILVTSLTSGKKIMVERSMYWNARGAGTDTIGGYAD
jgi:hypothetical protein